MQVTSLTKQVAELRTIIAERIAKQSGARQEAKDEAPADSVSEPVIPPSPGPTTSRAAAPVETPRAKIAAPAPHIIVEIIRADQIRPRWEIIDDDQLLAALASAGQPSGLVTLNGKAEIVPVR